MLFRERQLMSSFKLGDWVISTKYPKANPIKVQHQHAIDTGVLGTYVNSKGQASLLYAEECKLWQPSTDEWCWFWNKCMDIDQSPRLAQFHFIVEELQEPMDFPAFYQIKYKATKLGYLYDFCEPFIGQLPRHLKDQS